MNLLPSHSYLMTQVLVRMTPEGRHFSPAELRPLTRPRIAGPPPLERGRGAGGEGAPSVRQG